MSVLVLKVVFRKMEKGVGRSTQRVLSWHGKGSEYLKGTVEEMVKVMCDWPFYETYKGYPLPRDFTNNVF
jgi:hypothetical protein